MDDFRRDQGLIEALSTCDLEPIHTPGCIQPFGVMLAGAPNMRSVAYCSGNTQEYLKLSPTQLLGKPFSTLFDNEALHDICNTLSAPTARAQRERVGAFTLSGGTFEVYAHLNTSGTAVIELEPVLPQSGGEQGQPVDRMRKLLAAAHASGSIDQLLKVSVAGLQALTGYDRVMAYRYEPNGDGEVVAEAHVGLATSFLGQRYPSWDVPEQARALQVKNPVRMLVDIAQVPVPVLALSADDPPLEMSLAHLRGVSPVHVEYLKNMEVGATLTIGLVVGGRLWGMFSCHHRGPKIVSSDLRIAVELYGQMISLLIRQRQDAEKQSRIREAAEAREAILAEDTPNLSGAFQSYAHELREVMRCDGIALVDGGGVATHGQCPSTDTINALVDHVRANEAMVQYAEKIGDMVTGEAPENAATGGALLIRASHDSPTTLACFRLAEDRTLKWAGKPEKRMEKGPLGPRISPRQSFAAYTQKVSGHCAPWTIPDQAAAEQLQEMVSRIAARREGKERRDRDGVGRQRRQELMIAELSHRVRNTLALIRSLSRQAKASSGSLDSYALALEQRISALATAHDLAVLDASQGISLRNLLKTELAPYLDDARQQVLLSGPPVGLRADVGPLVALVLHELATNAAKHGALSSPDGIVRLTWNGGPGEPLEFTWTELNGPPVSPPTRHGFGRSLIEKAIPFELDGHARLEFRETGVHFVFSLPGDAVVAVENDAPAPAKRAVKATKPPLANRSALVVEDNAILAMDMSETLTRLGAASVDTASSVEAALSSIARNEFDLVLLDMNLRGEVTHDLARTLIAKGIPFIFATGYGSAVGVPQDLSNQPLLTKPVDEASLAETIDALQRETV